MQKEKLQDFTLRVTQSNRSELVVVIYEIIQTYLEEGKAAYEAADIPEYKKSLKKAQQFVCELMESLDFQYEISYQLASLYIYANKMLIRADMKKDPSLLKGVEVVINGLHKSFAEVAKQDKSAPVMGNAQQVYEGFTYGKDSMNAVFQNGSGNRGFTV